MPYRLQPRPLLFFLLSLPFLLSAQEVIETGFGLELFPNVSNRRLAAGSDLVLDQLVALDSLENATFGYGIGLVYDNRLDKLGYTVGLRAGQAGYRTLEQRIGDPLDNRGFRITTRTRFLTVPLEINFFQDISEKDRVLFFFGGEAHLHLSTRIRRQDFAEGREIDDVLLPESDAVEYRAAQFSLSTGLGYDRKLSNEWAFRLQPTARFFLSSNTKRDEVDRVGRSYYQLGLRLTVRRIRVF